LLAICDLYARLEASGRLDELALESLGLDNVEGLRAAGYNDITDIFVESNLGRIARAASLNEAEAQKIMRLSEEKLAKLEPQITVSRS
jgi:hypothetical protein